MYGKRVTVSLRGPRPRAVSHRIQVFSVLWRQWIEPGKSRMPDIRTITRAKNILWR